MATIKLSKLKLSHRNPRRISKAALEVLKKSIEGGNWMMALERIKVDENFEVISGNQRVRALMELGYKEVPSDWVEVHKGLSEEQKREYILKANFHYGQFDIDLVDELYDPEELEEWGFYLDDAEDVELDVDAGEDEDGKPRRLSSDYSPFNLVMLIDNKKALNKLLIKIKAEIETDSMEEAMMHLVNSYKPKK